MMREGRVWEKELNSVDFVLDLTKAFSRHWTSQNDKAKHQPFPTPQSTVNIPF